MVRAQCNEIVVSNEDCASLSCNDGLGKATELRGRNT